MWTCPNCNAANDANSRNFCSKCGAPRPAQKPAAGQPPRQQQQQSSPPAAAPPGRPAAIRPPVPPASFPSSSGPPPRPVSAPAPPPPPASTLLNAPKPTSAPPDQPRNAIERQVLRAAEHHAAQEGNRTEDFHDEAIDWDSPTALASSMGRIEEHLQDIERGHAAPGSKPSSTRRRVDTSANTATAPVSRPKTRPAAEAHDDLPSLMVGPMPVTVQTALLVAGVCFIGMVVAVIACMTFVSSASSGAGDEYAAPSVLAHRANSGSLAGVWLGMDHTQNAAGVPVEYVFANPNWLVVTPIGPSMSSSTQASYAYNGKNLTLQLIGSAQAVAPMQGAATLSRNTLTITSTGSPLVLKRPTEIVGQWATDPSGAARYAFNGDGSLKITAPDSSGQTKTQTGIYQLAGDTISVRLAGAGSAPATWTFTFDGNTLVLYQPSANGGAPDFAAPIRLKSAR